MGTAKVYGGADGKVPLVADGQVRVMMPKTGNERLIARIVYTGPVPAPVKKGQQIAALKVWRGDQLILTTPLKADESVAKGTLSQRAFDAVTEMVIALFRAGAERL
jgi:D-alanyl-D-alanine carboxypeptidase (penicillin-binding protein 5/6)